MRVPTSVLLYAGAKVVTDALNVDDANDSDDAHLIKAKPAWRSIVHVAQQRR